MPDGGRYDLTPIRVGLSIAAGALAGAFAVWLSFVWRMVRSLGFEQWLAVGVRTSLSVFEVALIIWTGGLLVLGLPMWSLIHRAGYRNWLAAALLGAVSTFVTSFALETRGFGLIPPPPNRSFSAGDAGGPTIINYRLTPDGWWAAVESALLLSIVGVLVAVLIWRAAYRRTRR